MAITVRRARHIRPNHPFATTVAASGRYLVDQYGSPFLVRGCSPWLMMTKVSTTDMRAFFSARFFQGFNTAIVTLVPPLSWEGNGGATFDGVRPFVGQTSDTASIDVTNPNETYWARVDAMFTHAAANGFTILAVPMDWWGWVNQGPSGTTPVTQQGTGGWQTFGGFIGNRYGDTPNVLWMIGHDYASDSWATGDQYVSAFVTGLRGAAANQPMMAHLYQQSSYDNTTLLSLLNFCSIYDYHPVYDQNLDAYAGSPTLPALHNESQYEDEDNEGLVGAPATAIVLRRQLLWGLTSGSPGGFYGHPTEYDFLTGWQTLNTTAMGHVKAIEDFWRTLPWHTLAPDDTAGLVTAGRGTRYNGTGAIGPLANSYATCCKNPGNTLAVVHIPTARTVTINEAAISGTVSAQWVDPTTGAAQTATGSSGNYTTPGNNNAGDGDWLLVVRGSG